MLPVTSLAGTICALENEPSILCRVCIYILSLIYQAIRVYLWTVSGRPEGLQWFGAIRSDIHSVGRWTLSQIRQAEQAFKVNGCSNHQSIFAQPYWSIPRDTYSKIVGYGVVNILIKSIISYGEDKMAIDSIPKSYWKIQSITMSLPNMAGLEKIADAVGGDWCGWSFGFSPNYTEEEEFVAWTTREVQIIWTVHMLQTFLEIRYGPWRRSVKNVQQQLIIDYS